MGEVLAKIWLAANILNQLISIKCISDRSLETKLAYGRLLIVNDKGSLYKTIASQKAAYGEAKMRAVNTEES